MNTWSFDIMRQTGWDLWVLVCTLGSIVLISYAVFGKLWRTASSLPALFLIVIGVGGTTLVIVLPFLHTPMVGMLWTLALMCIVSITFYLKLLPQLGSIRAGTLLFMRIIALVLLVPMFFEPVLRYITQPKPERPIGFVVDTSGSMSFPDVQNGPTRLQSVWQTLRPQVKRLNEHFLPRYFTFDTDLREIKNAEELSRLTADGKATDIVTGVKKAREKMPRKDAAIVLITDGIDNTSANVVEAIGASEGAVHTIRVGSDQAEPATLANVAVENVEAADDFIVGHTTNVKVTIKSTALANRVIDVKLSEIDDKGKSKGETVSQKLVLQPLPEGQAVTIGYKPHTTGVQRLAVWVDPIPGERSLADNRQEFQGLAIDPRIKVLYMEGRSRPEYKPLKLAMERDPQVEVATLLRTTRDHFEAAGSLEGEPFKRLPQSLEEWKKFDVIIIGDLDASFLNVAQQTNIEQMVSAGGGLLMIGGQNNFGPGGYKDSLIERALPVFAGELTAAQEKTQFVPRLTAEGQTHPAMEGLLEWFGNEQKGPEKNLPPLRGNVVVAKPKSGAQVLLVHADRPGPDGNPQIVLATQRYGQGRSAAFTVDTTYSWYLPLAGMGQDSPYKRFWGQLVRWLAGEDVRNRQRGGGVEGLLNKSVYQMGESVKVRAMVRDQRGDATQFAQVNMVVRHADAKAAPQKPLNPVESRHGLYEATIDTPDKGDWVVELVATKDGAVLGKQELKFTVIPPADEMLKIAANPELLTKIATRTGGYGYELAQLPTLIDELIKQNKHATDTRQEVVPLSNSIRTLMTLSGRNPGWAAKYDLPLQGLLVFAL